MQVIPDSLDQDSIGIWFDSYLRDICPEQDRAEAERLWALGDLAALDEFAAQHHNQE